ncbi:MAG: aminoacyltransferase [Erysipelotrichaceae bacterium]|nr:aminoacyltransferase [Erysipelotrichaceae bacterium]
MKRQCFFSFGYEHMEFTRLTEQEFSQFSEAQANMNFWQSTSMAHLRKWNGWNYDYVGLKQENRMIAAAMISYRKVFFHMTYAQAVRGFYIDYHDHELMKLFHKELCKYLKSIHCMYFKIDPYVTYRERDMNGDLVENGFNHQDVVDELISLGYQHSGFTRGMSTQREPNWMFVRDIKDKTEAQLLEEFDHQTRWTINKTRKMGIQVKELSKDELPLFKSIMDHTSMRRGFEDHSMHYYEGLFETFGKDGRLKLLVAQLNLHDYHERLEEEKQTAMKELEEVKTHLQAQSGSKKFNKKKKVLEEQIQLVEKKQADCERMKEENQSDVLTLAGATFLLAGKEIMYLYSGAYDAYMKFNAQYALQWHMFRYGIAQRFERYNFYGISGIFDKADESYGVYEFKRGFQGTVEELIGDFTLYVHPFAYHLYEMLRSVKHKIKKS